MITDKQIFELTKHFHRKAFPKKGIHTDLWSQGLQFESMKEVIQLALIQNSFRYKFKQFIAKLFK